MSRWNEEKDKAVLEGHGLEHNPVGTEDWDDWDDWDDDEIVECARVEAPNPWNGMWIVAQPDMFPKGFTPDELNDVYWELTRGDGLDKLMEAASFEEFDSYYNPGTEDIDPAFITEALVVKKFARTEAVMRRGLVKALRRYLDAKDPTTGTPIELLDPIVGKPRKSGMYAYVTVQLPFSDGQVVSILFHAPEGDGKRITPQDTIVAFRWMLNKRDITNIVAPEDGKEVSVATIGRRLSLLVEKNAPRFANTQKEAQAERRELAQVTDRVKELKEEIEKVSADIVQVNSDLETATSENGNTKARVQSQKTTNAELRAKLEALQKAETERRKLEADKEPGETEVETETGENGVGGGEETGASVEEQKAAEAGNKIVQAMDAEFMLADELAKFVPYTWERGQNVIMRAGNRGRYQFWKVPLTDVSNIEINSRLSGATIIIPLEREELAKVVFANSSAPNQDYFLGLFDKYGRDEAINRLINMKDVTFGRNLSFGIALNRLDFAQKYKTPWAAPETETPTDTPTATEPSTEEPTTENPVPDDPTVTADTVETEEPTATEEPAPAVEPEPATEEPATDTPAFVADLNDILAGKYDDDFAKLEEVLGAAIEAIEGGGEEMAQYYQLAEQASDRFTDLLDKDANTEAA